MLDLNPEKLHTFFPRCENSARTKVWAFFMPRTRHRAGFLWMKIMSGPAATSTSVPQIGTILLNVLLFIALGMSAYLAQSLASEQKDIQKQVGENEKGILLNQNNIQYVQKDIKEIKAMVQSINEKMMGMEKGLSEINQKLEHSK